MAMHPSVPIRRWPRYRTLWRWHFYAGLICIPVVLWLCVTGSIYLFQPQIDGWLERDYDHLRIDGPLARPSEQVGAALRAVPGGRLNAYELPATPRSAARVLVGTGDKVVRVYVHPRTTQVLGQVRDDLRFTRLLFYLHGELLLGTPGSMLVECVASWAVVMILTGLALWWPRSSRGLAGIVYPRLGRGGRVFWRDLHAVTGLWVSALALFLIVSGLPWSKSWGSMLKTGRELVAQHAVKQDWSTSRAGELAAQALQNQPPPGGEHAGHTGHMAGAAAMYQQAVDLSVLDAAVRNVAALELTPPVLVTPPSAASAGWAARSDATDRPKRVSLSLDRRGRIVKRVDFAQQPLIDRMVGYGVAAHLGQLFGWFNQLLGLFTAAGLMLVSVSAVWLWWSRRRRGVLGAPDAQARTPLAAGAFVLIVLLGLILPLLGVTLIAVLLVEHLVLRRIPSAARWLGLTDAG